MTLPRIFIFFILLFAVSFRAQAQAANPVVFPLYDSLTLDSMTAFTDLTEAMKTPDKVVKLVLRKQKLKAFPKEIWSFPNLQYLDLSKNQITDFPDTLWKLKNLQVIHLSRNKLESLPREIGDLQNVWWFEANQNDIINIPPQIGKMKKLKYLDLWSNNISSFPDELKDIQDNLLVLDLRVILINYDTQDKIHKMLPKTTVYFSPPCKCNE